MACFESEENPALSPYFSQQLYQTLSDYDIRFYMYEILKVSCSSLAHIKTPVTW